jgi:hypothetical protein
MADDLPIRAAHNALVHAIADLKQMGIAPPITLYLAAHSLSFALQPKAEPGAKVLPFKPRPQQ